MVELLNCCKNPDIRVKQKDNKRYIFCRNCFMYFSLARGIAGEVLSASWEAHIKSEFYCCRSSKIKERVRLNSEISRIDELLGNPKYTKINVEIETPVDFELCENCGKSCVDVIHYAGDEYQAECHCGVRAAPQKSYDLAIASWNKMQLALRKYV